MWNEMIMFFVTYCADTGVEALNKPAMNCQNMQL
jgi:hypothetical protein